MANYPTNPRHFLPPGFRIEPWPPVEARNRPHHRLRSFLGVVQNVNEMVGIAILHPEVAQEDFHSMAPALREYLYHQRQVRSAKIEPCPLGAAFVTFSSYLERDRIIGEGERAFGPYTLRFVKHDEGINATKCELDRIAWFMLLNYPLDCRHPTVVTKAVAGFGVLLHIHEYSTPACVIVKVLLHHRAEIPDDVLITVGHEPTARSFTAMVVPLTSEWVLPLGDEMPPPDDALAHPLPPSPPRLQWKCDAANFLYIQNIIKEMLCMHPPSPLLSWERIAIHDAHIDDRLVPACATAMVNMWSIAHDANIWPQQEEFIPKRFKEDVSVLRSDLRPAPFSAGGGACPGKMLVLATTHLRVAQLQYKFDWAPTATSSVDLSEHRRISLEMHSQAARLQGQCSRLNAIYVPVNASAPPRLWLVLYLSSTHLCDHPCAKVPMLYSQAGPHSFRCSLLAATHEEDDSTADAVWFGLRTGATSPGAMLDMS
ncbi:hypothetical protein EJB05_11421, partial [Eragrostis curvula]